jgi:2-haloacid dehalogenase
MSRDTVLFDINETVLDLSTLRPRFESAFGDRAVAATWFATLLHSSTVCALTGVKTRFADLARIVLEALAARRGIEISPEHRDAILSGFAALPAHEDVRPALGQLRRSGFRTVAFTNSSLGLVTSQIANAGLDDAFDQIISVEETGSFKPDARVYRYAAERLGMPMRELRLVAAHDWDTHGALAAGLLAAYIDRSGSTYNPLYRRPDIFETSMTDIAERIVSVAAAQE